MTEVITDGMLEAVDRLIAEIKETGGTMTESTEREGGD